MAENNSLSPWWVALPALLIVVCIVGVIADHRPLPPAPVTPAAAPEEAPPRNPAPIVIDRSAPSPEESKEPSAQVVSSWSTLQGALAESRQNGKPVMIDFSADWCGPCRRMKQEVFDDWASGRAVQTAVIPVAMVDRRREDGQNPPEIEGLQNRYQVEAFPTLVVFHPETGKSMKTQGYADAERTVQWITAAAQAVR